MPAPIFVLILHVIRKRKVSLGGENHEKQCVLIGVVEVQRGPGN